MATLTRDAAPITLSPGRRPRSARDRGPWPRLVPTVLGLIGLAAAPGIALGQSYATAGLVYAVTGGAAAASVVVTLTFRRRWASLVALLLGLPLPLAGVVALAATLPGAGDGVVRGAGEALIESGARILTSAAPTPVSVDTLALPLLATWLSGVAATLAWRTGRISLALVPGLVSMLGAVVLNGPVAPPGFLAVGVLGVSTTLLFTVSGSEIPGRDQVPGLTVEVAGTRPGGVSVGGLAGAVAVIVSVALVTIVVAPALLTNWEANPADPREALAPPMEPQDTLNPLSYLSAWAAEPADTLLSVRADVDVTLRWVTLGDFTGTTWLTDEGYRVSDQTLPEPVPAPPHAQSVEAEISVGDELPGPWAPLVGAPRTVGLASPGYDPMSGTVVRRDGPIAGETYEVTGDVAEWRPEELANAATPVEEVYDRFRDLPAGAPPVINEVVASVASGDISPYERANALAGYLRESHTFNSETAGGHGYASLAAVLAPPGGEGGGGTSEQFASAFAVLARAAGLPSRVAVGFDTAGPADRQEGDAQDTSTEGAGDEDREVLTGDAVAWGEVYFEGVGWVPFSVTPGEHNTDTAEDPTGADAPAEPEASEDESDEGDGAADPHDVTATGSEENDSRIPPSWVLLGVVSVLVVTLPFAVALARYIRQERRLRSGAAATRILGAWHELNDALRLCSSPIAAGDTVSTTVRAAHGLLGGPNVTPDAALDLRLLGRAVNAVSFGPGTERDDVAVETVVEGARRQLRALRGTRGRSRRLLWWVDPRPLLWRPGARSRRIR